MDSPRIHPETRIGCGPLKVANIERSLGFYRDVLGFEATRWYGEDAVFLSAGGHHQHIGLNIWAGHKVPPASRKPGSLYPERRGHARALRLLLDAEYPLDGVSEPLYLRDPDDNGVELYRDRPREAWLGDGEDNPVMGTQPLDERGLLAELDGDVRGG